MINIQNGGFFFIEIRTDAIIFSDTKITKDFIVRELETRVISLPKGASIQLINPVRGTVVGLLELPGEAPQHFTFEYLPFKNKLETPLTLNIDEFEYSLPQGARGIILLAPVAGFVRKMKKASIVELIDNYARFKCRGIKFENIFPNQN